jgi:hypothetical protein
MSVLFVGQRKAIVGSEHGKPIKLPPEDRQRVLAIAEKFGVQYEGDGGDVAANEPLFGSKANYDGSWDAEFAASISGYPPEFLYTLFTNVAVNKQEQALTNPDKSIFDSIMQAQGKVGFFKDRRFSRQTLKEFLRRCSQEGVSLTQMAEAKATPAQVKAFLSTGERLMWPDNWQEYPNPAGKMAEKANTARQRFLKSAQRGVFVVGEDHIEAIKGLQ